MQIFTERLNKLLSENKVTKYRLAKTIGVNKQTVSFWCEGVSEPGISLFKKVAEFFDVSADYLLGLENFDGSKPDDAPERN